MIKRLIIAATRSHYDFYVRAQGLDPTACRYVSSPEAMCGYDYSRLQIDAYGPVYESRGAMDALAFAASMHLTVLRIPVL